MAKDNLGLLAPSSPLLSFVLVAAGYEQWTRSLHRSMLSAFGYNLFQCWRQHLGHKLGQHLYLWYQFGSSAILEEWIFFWHCA